MSAICGIYYSDGRPVIPATGTAMMRELGIYNSDTTMTWQKEQVFIGCHARHITPESVGEILPYHDTLAGLAITADAIIDNRDELYNKFGIEHSRRDNMPDSKLILQAFRKWGHDCSKHLVGDFAFAIWDENRQELFCAVDHTGTRTLYYYWSGEMFVFSTLIKPIFVLPEIIKEYNETWIADFLAMPSVTHQLDAELTLYKNIYLLPAGHTLTVGPAGKIKQVYWEVQRQPELRLKSNSEYEEAFRQVFGEAVRCRLRSTRPVGAMLSGGLDSSSVAAMAAHELAMHGHRLQAFSSVPMPGYRDWLPPGKLADETPYIEALRGYAENIDVTYCDFPHKHSLSDTDRLLSMLEQPYKIFENLFWIDGIMASAKACNMGVMLYGGAGNITISWGDVQTYLLTLLQSKRWCRLLSESWAATRYQRRPLRALLGLLRTLLTYNKHRKKNNFCKYIRELSPINPDFARRISMDERFNKFDYDPSFSNLLNSFEARKKLLSPRSFSHLGVISTKLSLAYGIAWRDPTMDRRVIEFCLSVPDNQYVSGGQTRLLVRRSMEGILPDKVRLNRTVRGKQSADLAQRLQPIWAKLAAEISCIGRVEAEQKYLNDKKIQDKIKKFNVLPDNAADDSDLRMLIRSLIFSRFINLNKSTEPLL